MYSKFIFNGENTSAIIIQVSNTKIEMYTVQFWVKDSQRNSKVVLFIEFIDQYNYMPLSLTVVVAAMVFYGLLFLYQ